MKKTFLTDQTDDATWYIMQACIGSHEMHVLWCTDMKDSRSKLSFNISRVDWRRLYMILPCKNPRSKVVQNSRGTECMTEVGFFFSIQECSYSWDVPRTVPLTATVRLKVKLARRTEPTACTAKDPCTATTNNLQRFGTVVLLLKGSRHRESAVRACSVGTKSQPFWVQKKNLSLFLSPFISIIGLF